MHPRLTHPRLTHHAQILGLKPESTQATRLAWLDTSLRFDDGGGWAGSSLTFCPQRAFSPPKPLMSLCLGATKGWLGLVGKPKQVTKFTKCREFPYLGR